ETVFSRPLPRGMITFRNRSARWRGRPRQHAKRVRYPDAMQSFLSFTSASAKIALYRMNQSSDEDPHAPLSYHGVWRIVWLVFLLFIIWLIVRALEPVLLL